jgi:phosphatidate phosphatase PAH1
LLDGKDIGFNMIIPKGTAMAVFCKNEISKTPNKINDENTSWKDSVIKYIDEQRPPYELLVPQPKQMEACGISKEISEIKYHIPNSNFKPVTCNLFLWNFDDKVVISDVDGTITK